MALLLAQARNVPQAHAALKAGRWERSRWEGVELARQDARHPRPRAHRHARRPAGARLRHAPHRLRPVRRRPSGPASSASSWSSSTSSWPRPTSSPSTCRRRPTRSGSSARTCWPRPSPGCASSTRPAAASSTRRRWPRPSADGRVAGAALDVFAEEPTTESPLFELDSVVVTPHLGASTPRGAGQGRRRRSPSRSCWPWPASSCRSPSTSTPPRRPRRCGRSCRWPSGSGRLFAALAEGLPPTRRDRVPGPARRLRHPHPHAVGAQGPVRRGHRGAGVVRQRAAARRGARHRGPRGQRRHARDYVNLITIRGGDHAVGGTLVGRRDEPRIVMVDDHAVEVPPATTCWSCATTTGPG